MFKNLLLTVLMLFSFESSALILNAGSAGSNASNRDSTFAAREQIYIRVKNSTGGTLSQYAAVVADTTEDDGYEINTTSTAGLPLLGILSASCADNSDCLAQVYGYGNAFFVSGGVAAAASAGECFYAGSTAGGVSGLRIDTLDSAPIPSCGGVFLDASTDDDADIEVLIQLL